MQEHVYTCKKIWEIKNQSSSKIPKYEDILWGEVHEKMKVANILTENMKIRERYKTWKIRHKKSWKFYPTGPGDRLSYHW